MSGGQIFIHICQAFIFYCCLTYFAFIVTENYNYLFKNKFLKFLEFNLIGIPAGLGMLGSMALLSLPIGLIFLTIGLIAAIIDSKVELFGTLVVFVLWYFQLSFIWVITRNKK